VLAAAERGPPSGLMVTRGECKDEAEGTEVLALAMQDCFKSSLSLKMLFFVPLSLKKDMSFSSSLFLIIPCLQTATISSMLVAMTEGIYFLQI